MEFRIRNPLSLRYRIIVFDDTRKVWVVKHSGVTKAAAQELVKKYIDVGYKARIKANEVNNVRSKRNSKTQFKNK